MMKRIKDGKGITLIALVITIIVLLILAGVAISMLSGENGILNQAAKAKTETEKKSTEEAVKLATISAMTNTNHKVNVDELKKELTSSLGTDYTIGGDETSGWIVETEGETYLVTNNGDVIGEDEIPVQSIPVEDYGKEVKGYTLSEITTDVKWKIFLEDGKNIYLIADNYIERNNIPQSKGGHALTEGYKQRSAYFNDTVLDDYNGSRDIVENVNLSEKYNKWAYSHSTFDYKGIKAVAYMLDTSENVWGKYANNNYAKYAIGAPTLEMLCESYKKTHPRKYIEWSASNEYGYKMKWSNEGSYNTMVEGLDKENYQGLYFISESTNASQMCLASTNNSDDRSVAHGAPGDFVCYMYNDGFIYNYGSSSGSFSDSSGFRPVICLKTKVRLEKQDDESYKIK